MAVRALQREERHFEPEAEESADFAEEVVGGRRQQIDEGSVVADRTQQIGLEGLAVCAIAELDAREQILVTGDDVVDRPDLHTRVDRRVFAVGDTGGRFGAGVGW